MFSNHSLLPDSNLQRQEAQEVDTIEPIRTGPLPCIRDST